MFKVVLNLTLGGLRLTMSMTLDAPLVVFLLLYDHAVVIAATPAITPAPIKIVPPGDRHKDILNAIYLTFRFFKTKVAGRTNRLTGTTFLVANHTHLERKHVQCPLYSHKFYTALYYWPYYFI